jgi:hypothetical protein
MNINLSSPLKWLSVFALTMVLAACSSTTQQEVKLQLEAQAMGPFFAGPNSLIADYTVNYSELYPDQSVNAEQIKSVQLTAVTVNLKADSLDFSAFSSAALQFVSANEEMVSAAILNPIASDGQTITLQTSAEADLGTFFKGEAFTCVLDLDFVEDDYRDELTTTLEMTFNTTLKQ